MSCTMESTETLFRENAGSTNDSNNSDPMGNSRATSPIENAFSNRSKSSESSEDRNCDGADSNRERIVEVNTGKNSISNVGKKKYTTFLDSDSEEEENSTLTNVKKHHSDTESEDSLLANEISVSEKLDCSQNARRFIDGDSDESGSLDQINSKGDDHKTNKRSDKSATNKPLKRKFQMIIDSDSSDEDPPDRPDLTPVDHKKESSSQSKIPTKSSLTDILDSESEYEGNSNGPSPTIERKKKKNRKKMSKATETSVKKSNFNGAVDTDSEEDTFNEKSKNAATPADKSEKKAIGRTGSARSAKDEAMRQIHSETQRLVRNSAVSLPYHVPKQRTIQDFLNRRKLIPSLPEGMSTALKVKMSSEIVSKALQEKEREAETFYKSSDSEEEEITCTPLNTNSLDETLCPVDQTETQKILKNDLQNAHSKKEIIQEGEAEIGVPRKLIVVDEPLEREMSLEGKEGQGEDEDPLKLDRRKKTKEAKQGMREGNAPRKLFASNYDEGVDSPPKDLEMVSSDAPNNSEKHATVEIDGRGGEAVDEGIHSLEKKNESSDSCEENDYALKVTDSELPETLTVYKKNGTNANPRCSEALDISETPFISNRECAKLNEREKLSEARKVNCTENLEVGEKPVITPAVFGDVVGLPPPSFDEPSPCSKTLTTRKTHVRTLPKIEPKLRGSPGMMIDLTNDSKPDRDGVQSLRDRFFKHSVINKPKETPTCVLSVVRTEKTAHGLRVVEEFLPYKIPVGGFTETELQKPGAKYKRLKMDLIEKMAKKRGEEWELEAQREKENREEEEEEVDEEEDEELPGLDEEEGMTESEPEVNDMPVGKKKKKERKLREFADEEAEVSLDETEEEEDDDDISLRVEKDQDSRQDCSDDTEDGGNKCRKSRIVKAFEDDSRSSEDDAVSRMDVGGGKVLQRTTTDVDMFAPENNDWSSDNDSEFPPSQILPRDQADARSQICKTPLTAINALRFVSPITQLTALNTCCQSPKESPANVSLGSSRVSGSFIDKTPNGIIESPISCDNDKRLNFQKKLFEDASGAINDDDLMGLCSGKFTGIENEAKNPVDPMGGISSEGRVTETQLLGLCSGTFASQISSLDEDKTDKNINENFNDSCDHTATLSSTAVKSKYASLRVKSSSEDENSEDEKAPQHSKRRKVCKLELSDDEGSDNGEEEDDDDDDDDDDEKATKNEEKYVDYDSEENEIVVVPKKDIKKVAATFLEAEAELSESEWGSEDEDEKDMDRLEFEEGDDEEIDENQMRDQLGKIHMRRVQDDDQREVRMLQELLFDDGDLHTDGSGRERKFKWKNIDTLGADVDKFGPPPDDDDNGGENGNMVDDESDLAWLNEKLEREKFLEDKTKTNVDEVIEDLARDSQLFSLGMKALKKTKSNQSSQKEQLEPIVTKTIASRTILDLVDTQSRLGSSRTIVRKAVSRGSFLARGDECLARMAVHLKETNTTVLKRANPRNFVFGQINPLDEESTRINENEPGTGDISFEAIKGNKRKSTGGLTPRSMKKARLEKNRPTGKKLN